MKFMMTYGIGAILVGSHVVTGLPVWSLGLIYIMFLSAKFALKAVEDFKVFLEESKQKQAVRIIPHGHFTAHDLKYMPSGDV